MNIEWTRKPGFVSAALNLGSHVEHHLTVTPLEDEKSEDLFLRAAGTARDLGGIIVSQDVFGHEGSDEALVEAFDGFDWPVTRVHNDRTVKARFGGVQLWIVDGLAVDRIVTGDRVTACRWDDGGASWIRMGGLLPEDLDDDPAMQGTSLFHVIHQRLADAGLAFADVARTWFYFDRILDWYDDFNKVRTAYFDEHDIFSGRVPASTGMGGPNPEGAALAAGLLAVIPKDDRVTLRPLPSPLQCPALEYGSSFSRAMEISAPGITRVLVSGTASIGPEGRARHHHDVNGQIHLTMDVVKAILDSRGLGWPDATRAVAYLKYYGDAPVLERYLASHELSHMPVVFVNNDVCWDELLFEIEVDAIRVDG